MQLALAVLGQISQESLAIPHEVGDLGAEACHCLSLVTQQVAGTAGTSDQSELWLLGLVCAAKAIGCEAGPSLTFWIGPRRVA